MVWGKSAVRAGLFYFQQMRLGRGDGIDRIEHFSNIRKVHAKTLTLHSRTVILDRI